MTKIFLIWLLCLWIPMFSSGQNPSEDIPKLKKELATLRKDSPEKVEKLNQLAFFQRDRNIDSLYMYASNALGIAERIGYDKGIVASKGLLSFFYDMKGNEYLAFKFVNEGLEIARSINDQLLESRLLIDISILSLRRGLLKQASEYSEQSLQLSDRIENDSLKLHVLLNYGMIHRDRLSKGELLSLADQSFALANKLNDKVFIAQIENFRGQINIWKGGDLEESKGLFKASIADISKNGLDEGFNVQNYYGLGDLFSKIDPDSAVYYYELGMKKAMDHGLENLSMYGRVKLYEILRETDAAKASIYSEELLEFNRKFGQMNEHERLNYLEILIKENNLKVEEAKQQTRKVIFGGIGLFSMIVFGVAIYIWKLYRDKKRLSEDLTITNRELDDKKQFNEKVISILAHDLRQPFAAILMVQGLVKVGNFNLDDCKTVLYQMRLISEKSIQMLEGLLEWTKYNGLGLKLVAQNINLKESIESGVGFNLYDIEDKGLSVEVEVDDDIVVSAQHEMLLFLNRNIISNAVKYTGSGGEIKITAHKVNAYNDIEVCIRDSGEGIAQDVLERLFNEHNDTPFSAQAVKGAGIALIICRDMVKKMEGKIWAENNADGPGASFYYQLRCFKPTEGKGVFYLEDKIGA